MHHLSIFIKHFFSSLPIGVSLMTLALYAHGSFCVNDQELPILVHIRHVCRHYIFSNGFPNQKVSMCWKRFSSFLFTVIHDAPKKIFFLLTKRMLDSYLQIIVMKTWKKLPLLWSTSVCSLTNTNIFCNSVRGGERLKNYFKNKIIFSLFVIIQNCGNKQNNLTFQNINVLAFGIRVA